jgi:hypothetical protein
MVSSKWFQSLVSTPILWTYVEISGSDEDSLATAAVFTHLSHEAPLVVTIYLPLRHEIMTVLPLLTAASGRIQRVALASDERVYEFPLPHIPPEPYHAGIDFLLTTLQHISNVSVVEIGQRPRHNNIRLEMAAKSMPPLLRAIHGYCFCRSEELARFIQLEELYTCQDLSDVVPHLERLTRLRSLTLFGKEPRSSGRGKQPGELVNAFAALSNLTSLSLDGTFHLSWLDLLTAVAPNLLHLKLYLPLPQFSSILNILRSCIRLRMLSFHLRKWTERDQGDIALKPIPAFSISSIMSLRTLHFIALLTRHDSDDAEGRQIRSQQLRSIIKSITELSREVSEASFNFNFADDESFSSHVLDCISELPNLKQLAIHGPRWPTTLNRKHAPILKRLEGLATRFPEAFRTPNLLSETWQGKITAHINMPDYDNVRTLRINDYGVHPHRITFPQDSLPQLRSLTLSVTGNSHLLLGSFLALTSISMLSGPVGATSLCISLLYQPEDCPYLTDIEFIRCAPDWDILFIMLERRNFLTRTCTSIIRRICVPFIPNGLRASLTRLLRGLYSTRPSNQDLSFQGVVDVIFDKQM